MTQKKNYEPNLIIDINKQFGLAPATFTELVTLPEDIQFQRLMIYNGFDKSITVRLSTGKSSNNLIEIETTGKIVLDKFYHYGLIEWKYTTDAPTLGFFKLMSWPSK